MPATLPARFDAILPAPFGKVGVRVDATRIHEIVYLPPDTPVRDSTAPLVRLLAAQLDAYYADPDAPFDLPLAIHGTVFRQRVWEAIRAVPRGAVTTYGDIARQLDSEPRAVGQACGDNNLPIVIPCHRVVSRQGLGGFAHHSDGYLLDIKHWLLCHEGVLLL